MRKTIINTIALATIIASSVSCSQQKEKGIVTGTVNGIESGKVYLQKFDEKVFFNIDSAEIVNGKFEFSTKVQAPEIYGLSVDTIKGSYLVFLDEKPITVELDSASYYQNTKVTGSTLQDEYIAYKQSKDVKIDQYLKDNPSSLVSAYVLYRDYSYRLNGEEIKEYITFLDPQLKETPYIKTLEKLTDVFEAVNISKEAPNFTAKTPEGTEVSLSDKLGKGYLLIDFWASWCPPCRKENPSLVKVYDKYKDKGFDIIGISLDKQASAWEKAIANDHLTWTNVSDLKFWHSEPAQLYGVRKLPSNFLVDSKGVIIAKNLEGHDLDKYLKELYSK